MIPIEEHNARMELYKQGLTDIEISKKLYVSAPAIKQWRNKNGLHANMSKRLKEKQDLRMRLYNEGKTDKEIAELAGYSVSYITRWRGRNKLKPNKKH